MGQGRYATNAGVVFSIKYHLSSRSCHAGSVGDVSEATVRRYIAAQRGV